MKQVFIGGTDTSVGKTYVCGLLLDYFLAQGIRTGYQKWASAGGEISGDLLQCLATAGMAFDPTFYPEQVVYHFSLPASPHLAAEMEGRQIDPERIREKFQAQRNKYEILLVEGVGGMMVPLRRDLLLVDFLAGQGLPLILVARSGLGTLNHTLLSLEALRTRNISVLGIVFSDGEDGGDERLIHDNMATIAEIGKVKVFGRLRYCSHLDEAKQQIAPIGGRILQAMNDEPFYTARA